jgi:hypothetical protein
MKKALLSLVPLLLLQVAGCAASAPEDDPVEANDPVDSAAIGEQSEALVSRCVSGSTSLSGSSSTFRVSADVVGIGESRPPVAAATSTVVIPAGRTRTTITTTPRLDAGLGLIGAPLASWQEANVRLRLVVRASDGTVLCDQPRDVLNRSQPGGALTQALPSATAVPMSCTFSHAPTGQTVSARLEMSAYAWAGGALPGEAHASGRIAATHSLPPVTRTSCSTEIGWCIHEGARLLSLDINGDGKTDHVCHTSSTSHIQVNTTPASGTPDDVVDYDVLAFCGGSDVLVTGDINRDGHDDLVCVTPSTGRVRVNFASLSGSSWIFTGGTNAETPASSRRCFDPVLADFNGDGRDDLLCTTGAPSHTPAIFLASTSGQFTTAAPSPPPACINVRTGLNTYLAGDVNGDGRADLVCNGKPSSTATADTTVRIASAGGGFPTATSLGVFCSHTGSRLVMADANGDHRDDLACVTSGTGFIHLATAGAGGVFAPAFASGSDPDFCIGGGPMTVVDYTGSGREGLTCQVPAVGTTLGRIELLSQL